MLYLASVTKKQGKPKLSLAARKRIDEVWMALSPPEILLDLPAQSNHGEGSILLVEINDKKQVTSITPALPTIVRSLSDYSIKLAQQDKLIAEWKDAQAISAEEHWKRQQQHQAFLMLVAKDAGLQKAWDECRRSLS